MADQKISDLTELAVAPADDDYLVILDTDAATTKKVSVSTAIEKWTFLTTPLTSTSWDGDNKDTDDRAIVDLSTEFGVPAGVKAVLMTIQTTGNAANDYIRFGPDSTHNYALACRTQVDGVINVVNGVVPCDANGDVYCFTSGTVEGVKVWIWGYWL